MGEGEGRCDVEWLRLTCEKSKGLKDDVSVDGVTMLKGKKDR